MSNSRRLSASVLTCAANGGSQEPPLNDISTRNGSDKWELPVPGTFVIDTKGVVRFAHVDPNFMTGRADPEAVLDMLAELSAAQSARA